MWYRSSFSESKQGFQTGQLVKQIWQFLIGRPVLSLISLESEICIPDSILIRKIIGFVPGLRRLTLKQSCCFCTLRRPTREVNSRRLIKDDPMQLIRTVSVNYRVAVIFLAAAFTVNLFLGSALNAQQVQSTSRTVTQEQETVPNANQPYLLSSRMHLQTGTNKGFLIVRVDLAEGSHIYSLTQTGDARPTKLTVTPSPNFRLIGGFSPDRPAEVTVDDSDANQKIEKHKSTIQFFAPIEIAAETDPSTLAAEVVFEGQVCTAESFCMPIMGEKVAGKFAGFFQGTPAGATGGTATRSAQAQPAQTESVQPQTSRFQR